MNTWIAIGVTVVGCYIVKLAGLVVPTGILERPLVRRLAALLPVALLAALTAQQTFADGRILILGLLLWLLLFVPAGLAAAAVALVLRAPFLIVVATAVLVTGGIRAMTG